MTLRNPWRTGTVHASDHGVVMVENESLLGSVVDGRFRIESELGSGGMGVVYRATQLNVDREVAIKVLSSDVVRGAGDMVQRFEREARTIARLRHPNTLRLIDFGRTASDRLYIVTELLHGEPLNIVLQRGPLSSRRTTKLLHQICGAMEEFHAAGIVHRDLKPANLIVERVNGDDFVRVLDFGIARDDAVPALTLSQMLLGTPAYMSPEQSRGENASASSDLYSLGIIAYECLTGRPPFLGDAPLSILLKQISEAPAPLNESAQAELIPGELNRLVMQLIEKHPADRPSSASEVRRRLERIEEGPTSASQPVLVPQNTNSALYLSPPTPEPIRTSLSQFGRMDTHLRQAAPLVTTDPRVLADPASLALHAEKPIGTLRSRRGWVFGAVAMLVMATAIAASAVLIDTSSDEPLVTTIAEESLAPVASSSALAPVADTIPTSTVTPTATTEAAPSVSQAVTAPPAPKLVAARKRRPAPSATPTPAASSAIESLTPALPSPVVENAKVAIIPLLSAGVTPTVDVFVDGIRHGRGSTIELQLAPGQYRIDVVAGDGAKRDRVLRVRAGEKRREIFILD